MATTKKSIKAKTKTQAGKTRKSSAASSKKPASKTTQAARTTKNTASSKLVKKIPTKTSSMRPVQSRVISSLQRLYFLNAAVSLGLAVLAGFLISNKAVYQLFTGLLTKDELASRTTTVFAPAIHSVYDLELRWMVVGIMALSTILPLLYVLYRGRRDETALNSRLHFWRWLEFGIITGLMVEVVALLSGIQDIMTLKVIGGTIVISALLRWVAEKQQIEGSALRKSTSVLSIVTCLLPGLLIGTYAFGTFVFGMVRSPWYVYALYATLIVGFFAYLINLRFSLTRTQTGMVTHRNYMLVGLLVRIAFVTTLIYGLHI